jgi:sugar lactone lactonase YvrE
LAAGTLIVGSAAAAVATGAPASAQDPAAQPFIFVTNHFVANGGSVTEYAQGANGDTSPVATINGPDTKLSSPNGVALDSAGNVFAASFVTLTDSRITEYANGASADSKPVATIEGSNTGLGNPSGEHFDSDGNLWVANPQAGATSVTEYPKGANGNVTPKTTIVGSNTGLSGPNGVAVEADGTVVVANSDATGGGSITEYAKGMSGNVAPSATISGNNTGLSTPRQLTLDSSGNIFVVNETASPGGSVTEYAKGANGNVAPLLDINGSNTALAGPEGVGLDSSGNVYATNFGDSANSVTEYAAGATGNVKPIATIQGSNTGLAGPVGLAVAATAPPPTTTHPLASSQQFGIPNQTDVFRVADDGTVEVNWVNGAGAWQGPLAISKPGLAPQGAHLAASNQFGIANQTDVFVTDNTGTVDVLWVDSAGAWNGPLAISPSGFAPAGAGLAASQQFGSGQQTDVFVTDSITDTVDVLWVQVAGKWNGPLGISPFKFAPAAAALAASNQFGIPNQTDVFVTDNTGTVDVLWVDSAGAWNGPLGISPGGLGSSGAPLAASNQFGIPNQTDVFLVDTSGTLKVLWVDDTGRWNGPLAI